MCEIGVSPTAGIHLERSTLMNLLKPTVISLLLCLASGSLAEQILLQDGSTINGEVISLQSGSYRVKTESLGVITLQQHQVKSISHGPVQTSAAVNGMAQAGQSAVQSLQSSITSDPGMMANILQLQNDPDMQAILNDPELMRAIQSFDLQALQSNPKIQKLMRNPTVQDIQGNVNQ